MVAVAVSGGADSLYTLLRLREAGVSVMAVHGIFGQYLEPWLAGGELGMRGAGHNERADAVCGGLEDACRALGIPLHFVDCAQHFVERVVRPFVELYATGRTPNPCALCNAGIKLGLLRKKAQALGAQHIATGHYVRLEGEVLLQGADLAKDQSYFLALVPRESLRFALFPLGSLRKSEVLAELAQRGITPPQPGESQEVCFIPHDEYRNFLPCAATRLGIVLPGPGPMLLGDDTPMGVHKGLWQYTEGQRRGLGVAWKEPLHVLAKDGQGNILRLGERAAMQVRGLVAGSVNFLLSPEDWPGEVYVKTRYRERPKLASVTVAGSPTVLRVVFQEEETSVATGQILAVYIPVQGRFEADGRPLLQLVAGGVIEQVEMFLGCNACE